MPPRNETFGQRAQKAPLRGLSIHRRSTHLFRQVFKYLLFHDFRGSFCLYNKKAKIFHSIFALINIYLFLIIRNNIPKKAKTPYRKGNWLCCCTAIISRLRYHRFYPIVSYQERQCHRWTIRAILSFTI